jgi:hypothetical protein
VEGDLSGLCRGVNRHVTFRALDSALGSSACFIDKRCEQRSKNGHERGAAGRGKADIDGITDWRLPAYFAADRLEHLAQDIGALLPKYN